MTKNLGRPVDLEKEKSILNAAHSIWFGEGPEHFSMEKVARLAGVSKVTIYAKFATKDKLIQEAVILQSDFMTEALDVDDNEQGTLAEVLTNFGTKLVNFIHSDANTAFMKSSSVSASNLKIELEKIYENGPAKANRKLAALLDKKQKTEKYEFPDPISDAEMFIGMLLGLSAIKSIHNIDIKDDIPDVKKFVEKKVGQFLKIHSL